MQKESKTKFPKLLKEILPYIIIVIVVVLIRTFIATPVKVDGESMYPTLHDNDIMILNKLTKLKRYKIVVVDYEKERLIKRLYGLPGETISGKNNQIYINGQVLDEDYGYGTGVDFAEITLTDDECFVIGDNREVSGDSRIFGAIKCSAIEGTTKLTIFPFNRFGNKN